MVPCWFLFQLSLLFLRGWFFFSVGVRRVLLLLCRRLKGVFLVSSSIHGGWFFVLSSIHGGLGAFYFVRYLFCLRALIVLFVEKRSTPPLSLLGFLLLIGVPPFPLFMIKWVGVGGLLQTSFLAWGLFLQLVLLRVVCYFCVAVFLLWKASFNLEGWSGAALFLP